MKSQGKAYVTVKLTEEQHGTFKEIAFAGKTTMKRLLAGAIEELLSRRYRGEPVEYTPSRRNTKPVLMVVSAEQSEAARAQAKSDRVFFTAFYTTALLTVLQKNQAVLEVAKWH